MKTNTKVKEEITTNNESGLAYQLAPRERLYQRVLTCFFGEKKFYGNQDDEIKNDIKLVAKEDPEYILKLASYARNEMYLRTIPQVLLVECANLPEFKGTGLINKYTKQIVQRADEITEVLAYQLETHKKPIPNSLIRGLKEVFEKFSAYQLSKYKASGAKVKLKDAVRMIHPKPADKERSKIYNDIVKDTLTPARTWEHELMTKGASKETWDGIIPIMGYMALLRNLRNFVKHDANLVPVIAKLTDPEQVARSKQYPFRFFSAYRELEKGEHTNNSVLNAINDAMELSTVNIPVIKGTTFMSSDLSGSMDSSISEKSKVTQKDIGCIMQAITLKVSEKTICSGFGEKFEVINLSQRSTILDNMNKIKNLRVGHSTNGYKALQYLNNFKILVDRIMIFTDEEMYDSDEHSFWGRSEESTFKDEWNEYKQINPKAKLYVFNLAGYGTTVVSPKDPNVALISGWSEKILNFVELFEANRLSMLGRISSYDGPK